MTISFSIGLRHVLEDCLKTLRGRPLDPGRRIFALERGFDLVTKARSGCEATARASGFVIDAADADLDAYRLVLELGGARRTELAADLAAAERALGGLLRGGTAIAARDIASAEDLLSTMVSVGQMTETMRAMETI